MIFFNNFLFISFLFILNSQTTLTSDVYFDKLELLNSSYVERYYNMSLFRIAKYNRTAYVANVQVEFFIPFDENIFVEVVFYYNRMNNQQYTKSMVRVPKSNLCTTMEKYAGILILESIGNVTNLPVPRKSGDKYCPQPPVGFISF